MSTLASFQAAEARLPALDPAALERLPSRPRQIFLAIAALHAGERAQVLAAAAAARDAGEADIAWLLELMADEPPPGKRPALRDLPGEGEVPELLAALHGWRTGGAPRGSAGLRRLAAARPALRSLLDVLGHKRDPSSAGLARLSPRAPRVLAAADACLHDRDPELAGYRDPEGSSERLRPLYQWVEDPQAGWGFEQATAILRLFTIGGAPAQQALHALLLAVHRRLAADQGRGLLGPILACRTLASCVAPAMSEHLDVLMRRLGGLLDPAHHITALLTLWRRCTARPQRERMTIARKVVDAVSQMIDDDIDPPEQMSFVCEVLAYLAAHSEPLALRVALLERLGWLLPEARLRELLEPADPATRTYLLARCKLTTGDLDASLAAVTTLSRMPDAGQPLGKLLVQIFEACFVADPPPRVLRQLEQTLATLTTTSLQLADELLPKLLADTRDLGAGVEQARALVRKQLARPLADGAPALAEHVVARHLLADDEDAQELVRRLGRWLRRADPDAADDLALEVLARVFAGLELSDDEDGLQRLVAPLTGFLLREGPERPLRAALRVKAASSPLVHGYGSWARAHADRLGPAPLWRTLIAMTDAADETHEFIPRHDVGELPY